MISVDDRIGSIELIPILQEIAQILCSSKSFIPPPRITSCRMVASDFCFDGLGACGKRIGVGIERKRISDMLNSIRSGRYAGSQMVDMLALYDDCYLIVEGYHRCSSDGYLEILHTQADPLGSGLGGKWFPLKLGQQLVRYTELDHFLCTQERCTKVKVRRTNTEYETAAQVISLYTHYQQEFDKHHSHQALHQPQHLATIGKAGLVRKWAADLDGVGWSKSGNVAVKFKTGLEMANASIEDWMTIKPGFGKVLAKRAYDQIRGDHKGKGEL
jgi:ERCC4-type nuclease